MGKTGHSTTSGCRKIPWGAPFLDELDWLDDLDALDLGAPGLDLSGRSARFGVQQIC